MSQAEQAPQIDPNAIYDADAHYNHLMKKLEEKRGEKVYTKLYLQLNNDPEFEKYAAVLGGGLNYESLTVRNMSEALDIGLNRLESRKLVALNETPRAYAQGF